MFITTQSEIVSLMPTARWDRPSQLLGYLEEEERVALEPLLGTALYQHLLGEYTRLKETYVDITAATVRPTGLARHEPELPYADVTERLDAIQGKRHTCGCHGGPVDEDYDEVEERDMAAIRLIRICQQIEFYRMIAHKAGLLTVSFNEGGGMNMVSADGYEPADEKRMERVVKDAFMSAGRATDSLLLFLEADAKGERLFTDLWKEADAFYLHRDLLFQTARVLNEYLDIKGERMAYVALVRDIRFCQNTYLKPRVGARLLKAAVRLPSPGDEGSSDSSEDPAGDEARERHDEAMEELRILLRTALAFYVEGRRVALEPTRERLARRDSMTDAQQAMAMACQFIEENLDALGEDAVGTPVYNAVRAREEQEARDRACACAAAERQRRAACEQASRKLFTGFPATHRTPERRNP